MVSGAVDSGMPSGAHTVESSSDKDHFKFPYKKLCHDLRHGITVNAARKHRRDLHGSFADLRRSRLKRNGTTPAVSRN